MSEKDSHPAGSSTGPAVPAPASLKGLGNRLKIKSKMVRKIAIMDLVKHHAQLGTRAVVDVLASHLEREDQPALQMRVIEFFEDQIADAAGALPVLQKLADDDATDAQVRAVAEYAVGQLRG